MGSFVTVRGPTSVKNRWSGHMGNRTRYYLCGSTVFPVIALSSSHHMDFLIGQHGGTCLQINALVLLIFVMKIAPVKLFDRCGTGGGGPIFTRIV